MSIRVSPRGTRGARVPKPLMKLFNLMGERMISGYRRSGGKSLSSRMGFPVVILTTRGAKSGQFRTTPVGGFPDGDNAWHVVGSLGGAARHPAWFLNMAARPDDIWLEVGAERFKVLGQTVDGPERLEALKRVAAVAPRYGKYQERTDREIPVVRLTHQPVDDDP